MGSWVTYYKKLNRVILEGLEGTNPNTLIINILGIIFVESEGIEPSSIQANNTPSTCLVSN